MQHDVVCRQPWCACVGGDLVQIETWFQEEGRIAACRNWIIRNITTKEELGRATR